MRQKTPQRLCVSSALFAVVLAIPALARAHGPAMQIDAPDNDWAIGPAVAFMYGPRSGWGLNIDTAYTNENYAASLNLKTIQQPDWHEYGAQVELSMWMIANFGLGAGYLGGTEHGPVFHLFTGFPFGDGHVFLEPYYRLNFFVPGNLQLIHEAGLMMKYTTFTI